ncbi:hypothetical protein GPALN_011219 [Globodera pallida]|nr:hypothetical protein GPALN_011219 [Globodera pallida]
MAQQMTRAALNHRVRVLSVLEKVKLVCWFEETHSFAQVARRYRAEFGIEPPQLDHVKKLHQRFVNTGSLLKGSATAFSAMGNGIDLEEQQPMPVVSDAGLDAEEQLRMTRM